MNVGDNLLTDEWAYPTALVAARPFGLGVVPVRMDAEGMMPEELRRLLDGWDEEKDGKKPRLIYTVPVGQNPSGSVRISGLSFQSLRLMFTQTAGLQRKKNIYDICVEHGLLSVSHFQEEELANLIIGQTSSFVKTIRTTSCNSVNTYPSLPAMPLLRSRRTMRNILPIFPQVT